jgi:hypothetical protein
MTVRRRVFVSLPADEWLTLVQNELKWNLVDRVEALGYTPEMFLDPTGRQSMAANHAWSPDRVDEIARHCRGGDYRNASLDV